MVHSGLRYFLVECIDYRSNLQCTGDIIWETSTASPTETLSPTYQAPEGYGSCASVCIGNGVGDGAIAFNWINYGNSKSKCQCLRKVSNISRLQYS